MSSLIHLPVFGPEYAACDSCELKGQLERNQYCCSYRPKKFNGLMIIGEGPGQQEVVQGRPFVGPAGKLLRQILESVGLDFDECYVTNASLCKPPPHSKSLHEDFPNVLTSCLSRLEAEIEAVKPKVIVALGAAAWIALSGYDKQRVKHVPFDCDGGCNEQRKVGPVIQCNARVPIGDGSTTGPCQHLHFLKATSKLNVDPMELEKLREGGCQKCGSKLKRSTPKMVKCPKCGGRKRHIIEYVEFEWDLNISAAAGGIFEPAPVGALTRKVHELDSWYGVQGVAYVVPTYHPAHVLRGQQFLAKTLQKHFAKAKRLLAGGLPIEIKWKIVKDPGELLNYVYGRDPWASHYRWHEQLRVSPNFACDTETHSDLEGGDAREIYEVTHIDCIGIGTTEDAIVVDTREVDPQNPDDPLLAALAEVLTDPDVPKTYHHGAGYDVFVIDRVWGIPCDEQMPSYQDDTMFGHKNLYPDEPHDLGHVTFEFVDARAWKPPRTAKGVQIFDTFEEKAFYNARDTIHTARAKLGLDVDRGKALPGGRMDRAGLSKIYEMDSAMRRISVGMTMRGMPLDHELFRDAGRVAQQKIDEANAEMRRALVDSGFGQEHRHGEPDCPCRACKFNPNSAPQISALLFGRDSFFNLPVLSITSGGGNSTDSATLTKLLTVAKDEHALRFLQAKISLLKQNYVAKNFVFSKAMQPWADGRIHPIWQPWGTKTGRWSSSPNLQNVPPWLRSVVVAPEGRIIVGADEDQLELRGMAWLSGDKELIRRCLNAVESRKLEPDYDPHSFVASHAFAGRYTSLDLNDPKHDKKDPKCACETCKRKALRTITKSVIYASNYGAGEAKMHETIYNKGYEGPPITIDMIAHVKRTIDKIFPDVPAWRARELSKALAAGELRSPIFGRRRIFPLLDIPPPEAANFPNQTLGADIVNEALLIAEPRLAEVDPTAFMIAQVHDAFYVEADEDKHEAVEDLLEESMSVVYERGGIEMPFTVTAHSAKDWRSA